MAFEHPLQILGGIVAASIVALSSVLAGADSTGVGAAFVLTFIVSRWLWAAYRRTQHWLYKGTKGVHGEQCPNCNQFRHRISGDWILRCRRCGWKPGYPIIRWVTRSVPVIQLRRSSSKFEAFVAGGAATLVFQSPLGSRVAPVYGIPIPSVDLPNLPGRTEIIQVLAGISILVILVLWILRPREYYCKNCGQFLDTDPPDACPKCGSNRFTTEDPGVGKKIKIDMD